MKVSQQAINQAKQQWEICKGYSPSVWLIDYLDSDNQKKVADGIKKIAKLYANIKQIPSHIELDGKIGNETAYLRYINRNDNTEMFVTRANKVGITKQAMMNVIEFVNGKPRMRVFNSMFLYEFKMDMDFEPKAI